MAAMEATTGRRDRLRALVDAGIALSSELSLDAVLQKLVETAAELTGARYAALGVISEGGHELERFVFTGVDEDTAQRIGELPRGRGILGVLIRDPRPLRLEDLGGDPRSVGFPPHHPEMTSFLGVPILLRGAPTGTCTSPRKRAATSPRRTKSSSSSSPRRRRWRSRIRGCTKRRRGGHGSSSR